MASDSASSCEAPPATPTQSSTLDCVLLNAISALTPEWVEFPPLRNLSKPTTLLDVEILKPKVARHSCTLLQGQGNKIIRKIGTSKISGQLSYRGLRLLLAAMGGCHKFVAKCACMWKAERSCLLWRSTIYRSTLGGRRPSQHLTKWRRQILFYEH